MKSGDFFISVICKVLKKYPTQKSSRVYLELPYPLQELNVNTQLQQKIRFQVWIPDLNINLISQV